MKLEHEVSHFFGTSEAEAIAAESEVMRTIEEKKFRRFDDEFVEAKVQNDYQLYADRLHNRAEHKLVQLRRKAVGLPKLIGP